MNARCCGQDPRWVENVPGKGYYFCGECRSEVLVPIVLEEVNNNISFTGRCSDGHRWNIIYDHCDVCYVTGAELFQGVS